MHYKAQQVKLTLKSCSIESVIRERKAHKHKTGYGGKAVLPTFLVCNLQYRMNSAWKMDLLHIVFILHIYI